MLMIQYNNQHQLYQYLIHSSGVILYCSKVMELPCDRLDVLFRSKEECGIPFYFAQTF